MEVTTEKIKHIQLPGFTAISGVVQDIDLSYQLFGQALHNAPVVVVNHALTGNSNVAGEDGWWTSLIGPGKCIDTENYTVLAFNIPGNGYDGFLIDNYKDYVAGDIARIFLLGLKHLQIKSVYAVMGGSLGGGIAWEMAAYEPNLIEHLIPIAADLEQAFATIDEFAKS